MNAEPQGFANNGPIAMDGNSRGLAGWVSLILVLACGELRANEPAFDLAGYSRSVFAPWQSSATQCDEWLCGHDRDGIGSHALRCPSKWDVYVGAVLMTRDRSDAGVIIGANPSNTVSFSRGSDFDFNTQSGIDVLARRRFANGDQLEGRYFGLDGNPATQSFITPGSFIGAGFTGPAGTRVVGTYEGQLLSAEINWRRRTWERLTILAGFRYVGFDDTLDYSLNTTVAGGNYDYENDLFGGQIGGDWSLLDASRPIQLNVIGKAGVYGNAINGNFTTEAPIGSQIQSFGRDESSPAFVGDLQLVGSYSITRHIAFRGGYQVLWLDNVALASDNASTSQLNPSLLNTRIDDNGHVFFQGALLGAEFMW